MGQGARAGGTGCGARVGAAPRHRRAPDRGHAGRQVQRESLQEGSSKASAPAEPLSPGAGRWEAAETGARPRPQITDARAVPRAGDAPGSCMCAGKSLNIALAAHTRAVSTHLWQPQRRAEPTRTRGPPPPGFQRAPGDQGHVVAPVEAAVCHEAAGSAVFDRRRAQRRRRSIWRVVSALRAGSLVRTLLRVQRTCTAV